MYMQILSITLTFFLQKNNMPTNAVKQLLQRMKICKIQILYTKYSRKPCNYDFSFAEFNIANNSALECVNKRADNFYLWSLWKGLKHNEKADNFYLWSLWKGLKHNEKADNFYLWSLWKGLKQWKSR